MTAEPTPLPCDRPQPETHTRMGVVCGECCTRMAGLGVTLGGRTVLEDINLHLHCGEFVTLIGPNGAGKTTLLRVILGEVPYHGTFSFTAVRDGARRARPRIGYVPQNLDIDRTSPVTVSDLFCAAMSRMPAWLGHTRATRDLARTQLESVDAGDLLPRRLGALSGGEIQRVMLALALTPVPDILLLDEPLSSVDPEGAHVFFTTVSRLRHEHDLAVIMVSHNLTDAVRESDRIVMLNRTIVREGPPTDVLADTGVNAVFCVHPGNKA